MNESRNGPLSVRSFVKEPARTVDLSVARSETWLETQVGERLGASPRGVRGRVDSKLSRDGAALDVIHVDGGVICVGVYRLHSLQYRVTLLDICFPGFRAMAGLDRRGKTECTLPPSLFPSFSCISSQHRHVFLSSCLASFLLYFVLTMRPFRHFAEFRLERRGSFGTSTPASCHAAGNSPRW